MSALRQRLRFPGCDSRAATDTGVGSSAEDIQRKGVGNWYVIFLDITEGRHNNVNIAVRLADYENEIHNLRQQAQAWNHNHEPTATTAAATEQPHPPKTPDANAQQQQQQGRFANFASYFPYRRTGSRAGSKESSTPPQTSHSNYTNSSPGGGGHTSPTNNTSFHSHDASSDSNALALQTALNREQGLRKAAESQLSQAHSELEELTAQLFSQANEMVAQERKARAKLEERVALLEKRDGEKRKRLDRLEKAIARVERVRGLINS
jgi:DNA repair exonuclease SbcCD ATPase subunit